QVLVHPTDTCLGDVRELTPFHTVVSEPQVGRLRAGWVHDECANHVGVGKRIDRGVRPESDVEERIRLPARSGQCLPISMSDALARWADISPVPAARLEAVPLEI